MGRHVGQLGSSLIWGRNSSATRSGDARHRRFARKTCMVSTKCAVSVLSSLVIVPRRTVRLRAHPFMLNKTLSAAGIDASIIEVEVDVSGIKTNEDHFHTVGLPEVTVRESRDRVRAALKDCGYRTRDHVHPLIRVPANHSIADIARLIKTNSYQVGSTGAGPNTIFLHDKSATAPSPSASPDSVRLLTRKEHHKARSFQWGVSRIFEEERNYRG